jgi:hypothetical protein
MRFVKGVVIRTSSKRALIGFDTGRHTWATPNFKVSVGERVLVSWDYTNDCIKDITTQDRLDTKTETEVSEGFSLPMVERAEAQSEDEAEVEAEVFSRPRGERAEAEDGGKPDDNFEFENEAHIHETGDEDDMVSVHRHNINSLYL